MLRRVRLCDHTDYVAHQAPLSVGFPSQESWSGLLCPPPGDLPNSGIELTSLPSPALAGRVFTTSATRGNEQSQSGSLAAPDSRLEQPQGGSLSPACRGGHSRAGKRPSSSWAVCPGAAPGSAQLAAGTRGTLEREGRTKSGKELPGALPRRRAPSRDSRRGGGNKADLNCMDCKTATMKVIGEIFMYHSYCDFRMEAL